MRVLFFRYALAVCLVVLLIMPLATWAPAQQAQHAAPAEVAASDCDVVLDISGSVLRLRESWEHIREQLPLIVEVYRCGLVVVSVFDTDGWTPRVHSRLVMPGARPGSTADASKCDFCMFENIGRMVLEDQKRSRTGTDQKYRLDIQQALSPLATLRVLPTREASRSDVVGLLRRYSQMRTKRPRLVLVVTDVADTQHRSLPAVPAPSGDIRMVILLSPAAPKDALQVWGKVLSASDQYDLQQRELQRAASWLIAVPFDTRDLADYFPSKPGVALTSAQ